MKDYTFDGTPVAQMRTEDIHDCLTDGVAICEGMPDTEENRAKVRERLRIELTIRSLGLR